MKEYIFAFLLSLTPGETEFVWQGGTYHEDGTYECNLYCEYYLAAFTKELHIDGPYKRRYFRGWIDTNSDCQNTRTEILIRDSIDSTLLEDICYVKGQTGGLWVLPYTGRREFNSSNIDIDHIVPLRHAYYAGAKMWTQDMRSDFSNDPANLLATSASANRSKGAKGPDEWKPPRESYWCEYAIRWIYIKMKYVLSVTPSESFALMKMIDTCPP